MTSFHIEPPPNQALEATPVGAIHLRRGYGGQVHSADAGLAFWPGVFQFYQ